MSRKRDYLPEFEAPKKKFCSERDLHVKTLLEKQSSVEINLQRELQKDKAFETSTETLSMAEFEPGTRTYQELQEKERRQIEIEKLVKQGLSANDITMYFEYVDKGVNFVREKYHNHEPELLNSKIIKLINNAHGQESTDRLRGIPHPMNNIKELESNFMYSISSELFEPADLAQIRRKARKDQTRLNKNNAFPTLPQSKSSNEPSTSTKSDSLWDRTEPVAHQIPVDSSRIKKQYTCQKQSLYTIRNGEIVNINNKGDKPEEIKVTGKLSLKEIMALPPFLNYTPGTPSNVLYVKNLPKKINETELSKLFKERPAMEYKLMQGKMRGQAFLTYDSENGAFEALKLLNGLLVNDKPIVLQFGRKDDK